MSDTKLDAKRNRTNSETLLPTTQKRSKTTHIWTLGIGEDIWRAHLSPLLAPSERAMSASACKFLLFQWNDYISSRHVRVPEDVPTLAKAVKLAAVLQTLLTSWDDDNFEGNGCVR